MLSVTPTKLGDYLVCPHKFKLKHIEKSGAFSSSAAFSFGSSMHRALQELHKSNTMFATPPEIEQLLRRFWDKSAYAAGEEEESYFARGCQSLEQYCRVACKETDKTLGTEVYMSFVIDLKGLKIRLGCKVDRLSLNGKSEVLEIIDYKTNASGKVPTLEFVRADLPTFLYYVLTRISYPQYQQIKVTFLNVLTMGTVSVQYNADQIATNKQALWECLKTLAGEKFLPRPSEACSWCNFQDNCEVTNKIIDFTKLQF